MQRNPQHLEKHAALRHYLRLLTVLCGAVPMNCFSVAGDAADNDDARMKYYYNLTVH